MREDSHLLSKTLAIIYPFILIIGFYIILNSDKVAGGGFQGGGILSALFVVSYIIRRVDSRDVSKLEKLERYTLLLISVVIFSFMFSAFNYQYPKFNAYYFLISNILIGLKVFLSFGIIFYRFLYGEEL